MMNSIDYADESKLIEACLQVPIQQWAWEELYRQYKNYLEHLAMQRLGMKDKNDIEDIIQNVFIRLAGGGLRNFKRESSLKSYIRKIASNVISDKIAMIAREKQQTSRDESFLENLSNREDYLGEKEKLILLESLLRKLPNWEDRSILIMKYLLDMKEKDIAEHLNININTVASRIKRSISFLGNLLKNKNF